MNSSASQNKDVSWNCYELGKNGTAIEGLTNVQKKEGPDILFLSKTKMGEHRIKGLWWKLDEFGGEGLCGEE